MDIETSFKIVESGRQNQALDSFRYRWQIPVADAKPAVDVGFGA